MNVEGKQLLKGNVSDTYWEIDVKGVSVNNEGLILIECRCHNSKKQKQESIGALAYKIYDTGANGGIIISPLGLQKGAKKVANAGNIIEVKLKPYCNNYEYLLQFINKVIVSFESNINYNEDFISYIIKASDHKKNS